MSRVGREVKRMCDDLGIAYSQELDYMTDAEQLGYVLMNLVTQHRALQRRVLHLETKLDEN
jgi:hypothetical protein